MRRSKPASLAARLTTGRVANVDVNKWNQVSKPSLSLATRWLTWNAPLVAGWGSPSQSAALSHISHLVLWRVVARQQHRRQQLWMMFRSAINPLAQSAKIIYKHTD